MVSSEDPWFVYLVECSDGTLYAGITRDVGSRVQLHNEGKGAKYTRGRAPVELVVSSGPMSKGDALRLEMRVKKLPREQKASALQT